MITNLTHELFLHPTQAASLYQRALELARQERYEAARQAFEAVIEACPAWHKPWVSYAQMEKRAALHASEGRWHRCRIVLQRALIAIPSSPHVIQAWGLMELNRGNLLAACRLLERSAVVDHRTCAPVLRWKLVREAQTVVKLRRKA